MVPEQIESSFTSCELESLKALLAQDPRPHYHDDPDRIYGMLYGDKDVRFRVEGNKLTVVSID